MFWLIVQSVILIGLAYLIGCLIGCFARRFFMGDGTHSTSTNAPSEPSAAHGANMGAAGVGAAAAAVQTEVEETPDEIPVVVTEDPKVDMNLKPAVVKRSGASKSDLIAQQEVDIVIPEDKKADAEKADSVGDRPRVLSAPVTESPDNLKRVKGIGPKNEEKLNELGIYHFAQIAKWSQQEANWLGTFMAFPGRIEREDWINQAKSLAAGEETEFSKRVDKGNVESSL